MNPKLLHRVEKIGVAFFHRMFAAIFVPNFQIRIRFVLDNEVEINAVDAVFRVGLRTAVEAVDLVGGECYLLPIRVSDAERTFQWEDEAGISRKVAEFRTRRRKISR